MTALDQLTIGAKGRGGANGEPGRFEMNFKDWTSFSMTSSMVQPAELSLELGDDTGWDRLQDLVQLGAEFACFVGDRPRMAGRVEAVSAPSSAGGSSTQQVVIRTKLSDAVFASAPQGMRLARATIKDFIVAAYSAIGFTEDDFDFQGDVSRDLMTGVDSRGKRPPPAFETLTIEDAKVMTTESVFAAVDRHLRRHGLLHWDGPDGRIVVAAPDDQQDPAYRLRSRRPPNARANNICEISRDFDVSTAPTQLGMFGKTGGGNFTKAKVGSVIQNTDLVRAGFRRAVIFIDESLKNKAQTLHRASREFSARSRGLERLNVKVDGLQYREGNALLPWTPDTTVDVTAEQLGGALGTYYLESVTFSRNASQGDTTMLSLVKQGAWVL